MRELITEKINKIVRLREQLRLKLLDELDREMWHKVAMIATDMNYMQQEIDSLNSIIHAWDNHFGVGDSDDDGN